MKNVISVMLSVLLLFSVLGALPVCAQAEGNEYFEDGSFISMGYGSPDDYWESLNGEEESSSGDVFSFIKRLVNFIKAFFEKMFGKTEPENTVHMVSRTKYAAYYDSKGNLLWTVYLTASFTFDGERAECTSVSTRYDIKDSDWNVLSVDCDKADNTATGRFTVKQHKLGVPLKEIERVLTLTCDEKGNVK